MSQSKIVELHKPCPFCDSSDAYSTWDDGHGYCFSCETYSPPAQSTPLDYANRIDTATYQYVPWRGITAATFQAFHASTKCDTTGKPISISFRYPNGDHKIRLIDEKTFYWIKSGSSDKPGLFGRDRFAAGSSKYVTITEGELDALSLYQAVKGPVVSVSSASSAVSDCIVDRPWLNSFERIYLAFDGDASGREATRSVAKLFDYDKVWHVKFTNRKDANEYLQAGEEKELRNIWWNSKKYLPDTLISAQEDFVKVLKDAPKYGIPYPFPKLTEMTYGIRTGESVLLTAQEGVGKTELMHAIEYQLLRETDDAIGAIFLEEPQKRHLQALAGLHLKRPAHLPDSGCTPSEVIAALREIIPSDDRLYLYTHFGSDDPELLLDTIRYLVSARNCKYILLDHISMAVSGLAEEDERRKLDYFSTRAEMMVKELDFSLIIVSHVNDLGQTRGSRYIGKIADVRLDAFRDVSSNDHAIRNRTQLVVSKNRYSGRTGSAGTLSFNPESFTYSEEIA